MKLEIWSVRDENWDSPPPNHDIFYTHTRTHTAQQQVGSNSEIQIPISRTEWRIVTMVTEGLRCGMQSIAEETHSQDDDENDGKEKRGQWWHVNKGGFPVPEETWERMWQYVTETHPNGVEIAESIRGKTYRKVCIAISTQKYMARSYV